MRKVKANNVRIGDFIALRPPINGNDLSHTDHGTVETIVHVSPVMADIALSNGKTVTVCIGGRLTRGQNRLAQITTTFDPDILWIER